MAETTQTSDAQTLTAALPQFFRTNLIDNAESMLQAQVELLSEMEETFVGTLRAQQQALQKVLDLIGEARTNGSNLADQIKMQLAVSEQCFTAGMTLWRDAALRMSERTLKRIDAGRKAAQDAANASDEAQQNWGVVEKTPKSRRTSAEAA